MRDKIGTLLALGGLLLIVGIDFLIFRVFKSDYFDWYLKNGTAIGLVTAIATLAWGDLDRNHWLISSNPRLYMASILLVVGTPFKSLGGQLAAIGNWVGSLGNKFKKLGQEIQLGRKKVSILEFRDFMFLWDTIFAILFLILFMGLITVWILIVVPIQYFVFLICGSLPRLILQSPYRYILNFDPPKFQIKQIKKKEVTPESWWDVGFATKPVRFAALLSSLFLFFINWLAAHGLAIKEFL
jgi:hypothetical protein